jgi:sec-independent protein translocase protein TatB
VFGIGWTEAVFIAIIVLLFVGPKHLPGMMRKVGKLVGDLKSASRELQNQLDLETRDIRASGGIVSDLKRETLDLVKSPYEEARRMDEKIRRDLREAAGDDAPAQPEATGDAGSSAAPDTGDDP